MCMEDIRIGRDLASTAQLTALSGGVWNLLEGRNPNRVRFFCGSDNNNTFIVQFADVQPDNAQQQGFVSVANAGNLVLRVEELGKVLQTNIWAFSPGLNVRLYWGTASLEKQ